MRLSLQKRQNKFIKLINEQASLTLEGLDALKLYMEKQDGQAAQLLRDKEKEADEARRILIDELNRTFVTPFDREDIFSLSRAIDDVLDYAYSTADEMEVLKVESTPYMRRIASLLRTRRMSCSWRSAAWRGMRAWRGSTHSAPRRWRTAWKGCTAMPWLTCLLIRRISRTSPACSSSARCTGI